MNRKMIKVFFFFALAFISLIYSLKWIDSFDIIIDEETLNILLDSSGNVSRENKLINEFVTRIKSTDLVNPVSFVMSNYDISKKEIKEDNDVSVFEEKFSPVVYIYNTHQKEKYSSTKEINIDYSVLDASFLLQNELKKYGIDSIVENASISDVLDTNNWNYASSYKVSRMFMEKRKEEYPSLKYYIDLHRDSVNKNISTVVINGKKYAKTMFLLGLENEKYKLNENLMVKFENYLEVNYKGLSRGIYRKKGKGVNGIYNQDFSSFCILIEVGGEENTFDEVANTINVIAEMINAYIGGNLD